MEKITILPDGTIPPVEMTSLGFAESLDPYRVTPADIACVLRGAAFITEKNVFERVVTNIREGDVIGYKYFDFGEDYGSRTMDFYAEIHGAGCDCRMKILADDEEIGECIIGHGSGIVHSAVKCVTGRHAVYFRIETDYKGWTADYFKDRSLFELVRFVFEK